MIQLSKLAIHSRLTATDLGVFGKQMVDGEAGVGGDLALVGTFFVVVLVGTFASQVRNRRCFVTSGFGNH